MKRPIYLFFLLLLAMGASGQSSSKKGIQSARKGIQFFEGSWRELLDSARRLDKMVFVDVYTEWCGPCKAMDKFIFTEQRVGEKYNAAFLNYKLDAEKGEGISVAQKYSVGVYPTFLFVDPDGYLVHKVIGEKEKDDFIDLVNQAFSAAKDENNIGNLQKEFDGKNRDPEFLRRYLDRLAELRMDNSEVLDAYFETIPDGELKDEATLIYLAKHIMGARTAVVAYLIDHYDALSEVSKARLTELLLDKLVREGAAGALAEKRLVEYAGLMAFARKLYGLNEGHWYLLHRLDLTHGVLVRDYAEVKRAGYAITKGLLSIPVDSVRAEDKRRYDALMKPFLSGERDSTKIVGFEEERKFALNLYAREIGRKLLDPVAAFVHLPSTEKQALRDALAWAKRAEELLPGTDLFADFIRTLEEKLDN